MTSKPFKLHVAGIGCHHRLGVTLGELGAVVVGPVNYSLDTGPAGIVKTLGEVPGDHNTELALVGIDSPHEGVIVVNGLDHVEVRRCLKCLEQSLTVLAPFLVQDVHRYMVGIEPRPVAEQQDLNQGQEEHNDQAMRIPPNLGEFLAAHGRCSSQIH